jgi:CubicO group peptidase (beta-lactamase class C family)
VRFDQRKRRREFVMLLGGMAVSSVAWPFAVHAQQVERMRHVIEIKIDRLVSAEMSRQKIPGMAVAVVKNGEVVLAKGYGFANLEHQVPVTTHSIFNSGSVGKQFTAAAIMHIEEHGKLRLDDHIARYLPRTKARWGSITVRHLLTHTSGIPEYEDEIDCVAIIPSGSSRNSWDCCGADRHPVTNSNTTIAVTCCLASLSAR